MKKTKHGEELFYYENGQIQYSANYIYNRLNENLKAYYEDGKLQREEVYEKDKFIAGKCFDNSGEVIECNPYFAKSRPSNNWQNIIYENLKYPKDAKKNKITGRVIVYFIVEKDGSLSNFKIAKSLYPSIDAEAIRVVKLLDKFTPAFQFGEPVRSYHGLPISFDLY